MDDVLSALDVHTARSIVSDCLAGPLLRGRTIILVTHNVAMTSKHAERFIHVASHGNISVTDSIADSLPGHTDLLEDLANEEEATEKAEGIIDGPQAEPSLKPSGRLVMAEEIALGRATLKASTSQIHIQVLIAEATLVLLYVSNMGNWKFWASIWGITLMREVVVMYARAFHMCSCTDVAIFRLFSWWLGFWAHQYEIAAHPSDVSVPL